MRYRRVLAAVLALTVATAGCVGSAPGTGTEGSESAEPTTTTRKATGTTATATTTAQSPSGSVDFPEGPKEPPDRPPTLNESSVREYVGTYEYRIAYNSLWVNENTTVTLDCRVDGATERAWGYEAVVTCTGSSETDGLHGDWFTQSYRYRVGDTALNRTQIDPREPVS